MRETKAQAIKRAGGYFSERSETCSWIFRGIALVLAAIFVVQGEKLPTLLKLAICADIVQYTFATFIWWLNLFRRDNFNKEFFWWTNMPANICFYVKTLSLIAFIWIGL